MEQKVEDPIVLKVMAKYHERSQVGIKKYGTMLTRALRLGVFNYAGSQMMVRITCFAHISRNQAVRDLVPGILALTSLPQMVIQQTAMLEIGLTVSGPRPMFTI